MPETLRMRVMLEIYGEGNQNLRLTEDVSINHAVTLEEAARILTKFSELAKALK